nr:YbdD/YjiX family protein [Sphingomonas yunnanensis]
MVGQPDYDAYRRHLAEHHPEREAMTRAQFFREREAARYRGGSGRCC